MAFGAYAEVESALMDKLPVQARMVACNRVFEMRLGRRKSGGKHQISAGGVMAQNETGRIIALTA